MTGTVDALPRRADPRAQAVTDLLSPVHLVVGLLLVVGAASSTPPLVGVGWGVLAALFAGVLPYGFLIYGVRRGRYSDRHIRVREQRIGPLLVGGGSVIVGLGVLMLLGAPRQLVALVVAMLVGLTVTVAITVAWKVSVHTAVAAGTGVILTVVFGPTLVLTWPAVGLVAWSRVRLRDHTVPQVLAGAVMGAGIAAYVFTALR